jgi:hypothetical protein
VQAASRQSVSDRAFRRSTPSRAKACSQVYGYLRGTWYLGHELLSLCPMKRPSSLTAYFRRRSAQTIAGGLLHESGPEVSASVGERYGSGSWGQSFRFFRVSVPVPNLIQRKSEDQWLGDGVAMTSF